MPTVSRVLPKRTRIFYSYGTSSRRSVLSVSFDWTRPKDPPLSVGQASLVAALRESAVPVEIQSFATNLLVEDETAIETCLNNLVERSGNFSDVAIGAYVWNERIVRRLLKKLRRKSGSSSSPTPRIILGGPQISYAATLDELRTAYPEADVFIRGYAEKALVDVMFDRPSTGVHFASFDQQHKANSSTTTASSDITSSSHCSKKFDTAEADLAVLPSPFLSGLIPPQRFLRWETQRGCVFRCAFCQHRNPEFRPVKRTFAESRIGAEIDWLTGDHSPIIRDVAVLDPVFNSGPLFMKVLETLHFRQFSGKIALKVRAEMCTPEFLSSVERLQKECGATVVLECGLQTINREEMFAIERINNLKKCGTVFRDCAARGIPVEVSLIFGLPGQTTKSFQASIDFCRSANVPVIKAFPLMLLRGTPMYYAKNRYGLVESSDLSAALLRTSGIDRQYIDIPHVIEGATFSLTDWMHMLDMANKL